jgi:hypothetical protein
MAEEPLDVDTGTVVKKPFAEATFAECPGVMVRAKSYVAWEKDLWRWLRTEWPLVSYDSRHLNVTSMPTESERDFGIRLQ